MKSGIILGIIIGGTGVWLAGHLLNDQQELPQKNSEFVEPLNATQECAPPPDQLDEKTGIAAGPTKSDSEGPSSSIGDANKVDTISTSRNSGTTQGNLDRQNCLEIVKPSDIPQLQKQFEKQVSEFLKSNDKIFVTDLSRGGHYSRDIGMINGMRGQYRFNVNYYDYPNIKSTGEFEIKKATDQNVEGSMSLKTFEPSKGGKGGTSMNSSGGIDYNTLGTDSTNEHVNFVWRNGYISKWPKVIRFAIQIPSNLQINESEKLPVFALSEDFDWSEMGEATIKKLK